MQQLLFSVRNLYAPFKNINFQFIPAKIAEEPYILFQWPRDIAKWKAGAGLIFIYSPSWKDT